MFRMSARGHPQPRVVARACVWRGTQARQECDKIFLAGRWRHHLPSLLSAQMLHLCMPDHTHIMGSVLHASRLQLFQELVGHVICLY